MLSSRQCRYNSSRNSGVGEEYEYGGQCAAVAMTNKIAIVGTNETESEEGKNVTVACVT